MTILSAFAAQKFQRQAQAQLELRRRQANPDPDPLINPDPVEWIEQHFRIPETVDKRMVLQPYQRRMLHEALLQENGQFKYSTVVWCDIKKSAKSTLTAAMALWRAFQVEWGQVVLVANDLKQADSRVGYYLRRGIELNPEIHRRARIVNYRITLDNHAMIESVPIDPTGEAGGGADCVIFSELWGAHQKSQMRMWTEQTLSPLKYGQSFRWVETYAGFSGESPLLEKLYQEGVKDGGLVEWAGEFEPPLETYVNKAGRLLCMWNTVARSPWQTPEYYAQESSSLTDEEFRRVHRNQWISSQDAFISKAWWEACTDMNMPPLTKDQPVILALDAAVSGDTFGVLMVSGRRGYREEKYYSDAGIIDARMVLAFRPPKGGVVDFAPIEQEIRRILEERNVIELVADPYQLHDMTQRLSTELVANVYMFGQGAERLVADKALQDRIKDRRVRHDGNLDLAAHMANANAKQEGDNKLRIVKRADHLKIDLAVCLSMGADRVDFWNL